MSIAFCSLSTLLMIELLSGEYEDGQIAHAILSIQDEENQ